MYDEKIAFIISMLPSLITTLSLFVGFYFHLLNKIDERLEKERYSEDKESLLREIEIREKARAKQLDRIEQSLANIQEHILNCGARGGKYVK